MKTILRKNCSWGKWGLRGWFSFNVKNRFSFLSLLFMCIWLGEHFIIVFQFGYQESIFLCYFRHSKILYSAFFYVHTLSPFLLINPHQHFFLLCICFALSSYCLDPSSLICKLPPILQTLGEYKGTSMDAWFPPAKAC